MDKARSQNGAYAGRCGLHGNRGAFGCAAISVERIKRGLVAFAIALAFSAVAGEQPDKDKANRVEEADRAKTSKQANAQTIGKNVSGVFVNAAAINSGYSPDFVMRGFPGALTLFDGAARGFTSQPVNLWTIDHVEFYKGPSAMLFGKALGGYGGSANYIRKAPEAESFVKGVATAGAFDVRRLSLDINRPVNDAQNLRFRLTGVAQSSGSFVNFVRSRSINIAPAFTWLADNGDRLTLRVEHNQGRLIYRDGVPAAPIFFAIPREFYAGAPVNENENPNYSDFTLTHEHDFNRDWRLTTVVDYYLFATRWGWFTGWGYNGANAVTFGNPVRTAENVRSFDAQMRLNGRFETASLLHSVFLGLEHWDYYFGHSERFARNELAPINIFYLVYPPGIDYTGAHWANGFARAWTQSVYGQDLIDLSPQWRILLGGRYDLLAQRQRVFDPFGALSGEQTISLSKGTQGYFSPRAGILFAPTGEMQLFFAFGRSLIPNIGAQLINGEAPSPQRDTQYEVGFKRAFLDRKMTFELGLFDITRDNVAINNPANPSGFYSVITGQQHSHGIEVNIGGDPLPNLHIAAAATFLHAVVSKDTNTPSQTGSDLLGAPRRVYNFSANYTFDTGALKGLDFGASYYYASQAEATLPNTFGFTLPPQHMFGATLAYAIDENCKLEIGATNLTNRQNWISNGALFHGEPRSVSAILSYRY